MSTIENVNLKKKVDNILIKTLGELIDSLVTTNVKIFFLMEIETDKSKSMEERFQAGKNVIALNKKRNKLIKAIDTLLTGEESFDIKTY